VVLKTMGVVTTLKRRGIGRWLFDGAVAAARAAGFRRGILALMHDGNPSARLARDQRRLIRRYTLYRRPL
jgi:L-amino acid N-acyltransferase YncA